MKTSVTRSLRFLGETQKDKLLQIVATSFEQVLQGWRYQTLMKDQLIWQVSDHWSDQSNLCYVKQANSETVLAAIQFHPEGLQTLLDLPSARQTNFNGKLSIAGELQQELSKEFLNVLLPAELGQSATFCADQLAALNGLEAGRMIISLSLGSVEGLVRVMICASALDSLVPRGKGSNTKIERRAAAIGECEVRLKASVGRTNITLKILRSLRVGDVVMLDTGLDHDIKISTTSGLHVADGVLGRSDKIRAIVLRNLDKVVAKHQTMKSSRSAM